MPFVIDKFKSENGASVSEEFALLIEVQRDISDLPFVKPCISSILGSKVFLSMLKRGVNEKFSYT